MEKEIITETKLLKKAEELAVVTEEKITRYRKRIRYNGYIISMGSTEEDQIWLRNYRNGYNGLPKWFPSDLG